MFPWGTSRKQHYAKTWRGQWRRIKKCTFDHKKIKKNTKKTRVTSFYRHYFAYHCCCVIGHLKFFELFFFNFYKGAALFFFLPKNGVCADLQLSTKIQTPPSTKHTNCSYRHVFADCCVFIPPRQPPSRENK